MENYPKNMTLEAFNRERELFIAGSVEAYRKRLLKSDERPTQYYVAEERRISRATFNRQMAKYGVSWKEIVLLADCESCLPASPSARLSVAVRQTEAKRDA
jgi:hypothetical protein